MSYMYEKVPSSGGGLRLHLNENTMGCSPAVIAALGALSVEDAAFYPDYAEASESCANYLGVEPDRVLLTNGLDEGILAVSLDALRGSSPADPFEAIIVVPAFDMYAACADIGCARVIEVGAGPGFSLPVRDVLDAITPQTRIIYITDPNNPTGISMPREQILQIARSAAHATVFVDEAYVDFRGYSLARDSDAAVLPNVVIGRTFAKAHGLAALRVGALVAAPAAIERLRRVVPPYSLNIAAAVALPAALRDRAHLDRYLAECRRSRELLYAAFDRLGVTYWRSDANFVLARFGGHTRRVVDGLAARRIHVRDRSKQHGCDGCVRITAGVVAHTERAIAALEEVLCGAR